jgi:phosphoglycolate phosphatase
MAKKWVMARVEAVIFDFDFTLADSSEPIIECVQFAFEQLRLQVPERHKVLKTIGLSLSATFRQLTGQSDPGLHLRFTEFFHARADQIMDRRTTIYPSVPSVLRRLSDAGVKIAIVSTKLNYRIRNILTINGLSDFVTVIVGADNVVRTKPDPEGLLLAVDQLGSTPSSVIYVGDHIVDAEAASSGGIPFIAVLSGNHPRSVFQSLPHFAIVDSVGELPHLPGLWGTRTRRLAGLFPAIRAARARKNQVHLACTAFCRIMAGVMAQEIQTTARLEARLPNDVHALLKRAAEIEGRTLTDFVVSAAREAACRTLEATEIIRLSVEDQRQIANALLNPPKPTPALKKAFRRRRKLFGLE